MYVCVYSYVDVCEEARQVKIETHVAQANVVVLVVLFATGVRSCLAWVEGESSHGRHVRGEREQSGPVFWLGSSYFLYTSKVSQNNSIQC